MYRMVARAMFVDRADELAELHDRVRPFFAANPTVRRVEIWEGSDPLGWIDRARPGMIKLFHTRAEATRPVG